MAASLADLEARVAALGANQREHAEILRGHGGQLHEHAEQLRALGDELHDTNTRVRSIEENLAEMRGDLLVRALDRPAAD